MNLSTEKVASWKVLIWVHYKIQIEESKKILRDACLIHFDMNLDLVQRYCGGRWLGEHRRTNQMLRTFSHILPDQLFTELCAGLVDGVPNLLNAELDNKEVQEMIHRGNLPNAKSILSSEKTNKK